MTPSRSILSQGLDRASPVEGEVVWDPVRSIWNMGMLLAAIVLGLLTFSWSALRGVSRDRSASRYAPGIPVGFHRRLIHRSFDFARNGLSRILIWLGTTVGMGGPIWTIRLHEQPRPGHNGSTTATGSCATASRC